MSERPNGDRRLAVQHEITLRLLDRSHTLVDTLDFIINKIHEEVGAEYVDILFRYSYRLRVEVSSDPIELERHVPLEESISGLALLEGRTIVENDVAANVVLGKRYLNRRPDEDSPTPLRRNVIASPIEMEGYRIGVVNVESTRTTFSQDDADLIAAVAAQVSLAVTHAGLFDEDQLRSETDALLVSDAAANNNLVVRSALANILSALRASGFIKADAAEVLFPDPGNPDILRVAHSTNPEAIGLRVNIHESVCGRAFSTRSPVRVAKPEEAQEYRPLQLGMRSEIAVPIQLGGSNRFSIGVLNIESFEEDAFNDVAEILAERFAKRVVFMLALTKIRADMEDAMEDLLLVNAADQVLNAIHRINNHLGAVRVLTRTLLKNLEHPERIDWESTREQLTHLEEEATRSLEIPEEMRRRLSQSAESVDVNEQIRGGLDRLRIPSGVAVVLDLQPDLPNVPCTALDLTIENLVQNALNALPNGHGEIQLRSEVDRQHDGATFVIITVADNGEGMTAEQRRRLFVRRTTERSRGLGFGMRFVKAWVSRSNGLINVDTAPGNGTTVTIRFQIETHPGGTLPPPERSIS